MKSLKKLIKLNTNICYQFTSLHFRTFNMFCSDDEKNYNNFKCSCLSKTIYKLTSSSSEINNFTRLDEFYISIIFFIMFIVHMFQEDY